jgi:hypothetical protein
VLNENFQKQVDSMSKLVSLTGTMLDSPATHDKEYLELTKEGKGSHGNPAETDRITPVRNLMIHVPKSLVHEANPWVLESMSSLSKEDVPLPIYEDWRVVHYAWQGSCERWKAIAKRREEHFLTENDDRENSRTQERLFIISVATTIAMFACWLAQWIWWSGYVGVLGGL